MARRGGYVSASRINCLLNFPLSLPLVSPTREPVCVSFSRRNPADPGSHSARGGGGGSRAREGLALLAAP